MMVRRREGGGGTAQLGRDGTDEMLQYLEDMDGAHFTIEVELEYAIVNGATPNASRWIGGIDALFGNLRHGVVAARPIHGTSTPSQHTYGNAVDTFASWPTMEAIFNYGVANAAAYSIRLLILEQRQWYGGVIGTYGGLFHNHVHADFYPSYPL